jgi:hypothetical protein
MKNIIKDTEINVLGLGVSDTLTFDAVYWAMVNGNLDVSYILSWQFSGSRVSSGSIVSDYGLDDRAMGFDSRQRQRMFPLSSCVQTGSGAHPASCTVGSAGPLPGGKSAAGAWHWPLTPI